MPPSARRSKPRISANQLAEYMTATDAARPGIIRSARDPQETLTVRYSYARRAICAFLIDMRRDINPLVTMEKRLQNRSDDPDLTCWARDDARRSIEAMWAAYRIRNDVAKHVFVSNTKRAATYLQLSGVAVSVRPDLYVHGRARGVNQIGAAILRMTKDDGSTSDKRKEMGRYVATLLRLALDANNPTNREPVTRLCMSIDVQKGSVFVAQRAFTQRLNNLRGACMGIAALWNQV